MIGSQDDLLKFIMQIPSWYRLSRTPISKEQAYVYKRHLYEGSMRQDTKNKLCKGLGIRCIKKEYVVPAVWEYQRIRKPATEFQKYLGRLIFGYNLPKELKDFRDEIHQAKLSMYDDSEDDDD